MDGKQQSLLYYKAKKYDPNIRLTQPENTVAPIALSSQFQLVVIQISLSGEMSSVEYHI